MGRATRGPLTPLSPGKIIFTGNEDIDTDGVSRFHDLVEVVVPADLHCGAVPTPDTGSRAFSIFSLFLPPAATILWWIRRQRKKKAVQP